MAHKICVNIRVYLVVVDIRIVDCHMYPGKPCPPSLVLLYIPAEASMQYIHQLHQFYSSYILLFYRWCPQACSNRRGLESRASVTRTESMGGLITRVSTAAWEGTVTTSSSGVSTTMRR